MRQRIGSLGGNFRIGRVAGGGTAIEVFVPLGSRDAPAANADAPFLLPPHRGEWGRCPRESLNRLPYWRSRKSGNPGLLRQLLDPRLRGDDT